MSNNETTEFDTMEALLSHLINTRSDILNPDGHIVSLMKDCAPNLSEDIRLFNKIIESHQFEHLCISVNLEVKEKESLILKIVEKLTDDYFLDNKYSLKIKKWLSILLNVECTEDGDGQKPLFDQSINKKEDLIASDNRVVDNKHSVLPNKLTNTNSSNGKSLINQKRKKTITTKQNFNNTISQNSNNSRNEDFRIPKAEGIQVTKVKPPKTAVDTEKTKKVVSLILVIVIEVAIVILSFSTNIINAALDESGGSFLGLQIVLLINVLIVCLLCKLGKWKRGLSYVSSVLSSVIAGYCFYHSFIVVVSSDDGLQGFVVSALAFVFFLVIELAIMSLCFALPKWINK